jgi:protein SCO1/2
MKIRLLTFALAATFPLLGGATDAAANCCAAHGAAPAGAATAPVPVSPKSVYQLTSTWTDDGGTAMQLARFRGRPVVLAMFFASCEYACPILVNDMQRLRDALPEATRGRTAFVLVSFDVARDTPPALRRYRERAHLDDGWTLLHGTAEDVQELAMVLGVKYQQDARGQFSHSNLITVLNPAGEVAHQRSGLQGEVAPAARAVVAVAP